MVIRIHPNEEGGAYVGVYNDVRANNSIYNGVISSTISSKEDDNNNVFCVILLQLGVL